MPILGPTKPPVQCGFFPWGVKQNTTIQGVSEILGQTSEVNSLHQDKRSYRYMPTNSFRGTVPRSPDVSPLDFCVLRNVKLLVF